jgi:hypothetical protein
MSKNKIVFVSGLVVFLVPLMGFPSRVESGLIILTGFFLMGFSIFTAMKKRAKARRVGRARNASTPVFVDAMPSQSEIGE